MFKATIEKDDFTIEFTVIDFVPARQAPACSNPSSDSFSDSGDSAEFEISEAYIITKDNETKLDQDAIDELSYTYFDEIVEQGEKHVVDEREEYLIMQYENEKYYHGDM